MNLSESLPWLPNVHNGPLGLWTALLVGIMFCMREVELALAKIRHISFDHAAMSVSWDLPASKNDPTAQGRLRTWECLCNADGGPHPCPYHLLLPHLEHLRGHFGQLLPGLPVFPTPSGGVVAKAAMVKSIEEVASCLGLPLHDELNRPRFGGHTLRVTGARWLAALGLPLVSIQLLARWESETVRRYISEAPLRRLSVDYMAAAGDTHLRGCMSKSEEELNALKAKVKGLGDQLWKELLELRAKAQEPQDAGGDPEDNDEPPVPPAPVQPHGTGGSDNHLWIMSADTRQSRAQRLTAHLHELPGILSGDPATWRTMCGWSFGLARFTTVADRPEKSLVCLRCWGRFTARQSGQASGTTLAPVRAHAPGACSRG